MNFRCPLVDGATEQTIGSQYERLARVVARHGASDGRFWHTNRHGSESSYLILRVRRENEELKAQLKALQLQVRAVQQQLRPLSPGDRES